MPGLLATTAISAGENEPLSKVSKVRKEARRMRLRFGADKHGGKGVRKRNGKQGGSRMGKRGGGN